MEALGWWCIGEDEDEEMLEGVGGSRRGGWNVGGDGVQRSEGVGGRGCGCRWMEGVKGDGERCGL